MCCRDLVTVVGGDTQGGRDAVAWGEGKINKDRKDKNGQVRKFIKGKKIFGRGSPCIRDEKIIALGREIALGRKRA